MSLYNPKNDDEMNDESVLDTEDQSEMTCRICLEHSDRQDLISLCRCTGSIEYVHEYCIQTWILAREKDIDNAKCELCNTKILMDYHMASRLTVSNICKDGQQSFAFSIALMIVLLILIAILVFLTHRLASSTLLENINNIIIIGICSVGVLSSVYYIIKSLVLSMTKIEIANWKILPQNFPKTKADSAKHKKEIAKVDISSLSLPKTVAVKGRRIQTLRLIETNGIPHGNKMNVRRLNSTQVLYQNKVRPMHVRTNST